MIRNKYLAWLLIASILFSMVFTNGASIALAAEDESDPAGFVTITVEKFTLGQGYIEEPVKVPFYENDNGAAIITRLLGEGNYENTGAIDSAFYLAFVKDNDPRPVNVPSYILEQSGEVGTKLREEWLGQFDYTSMSGWMYAVNNVFPSVGFSDYHPEDGDVIRTQFTVYGFGADLGGSEWSEGFYPTANKDDLTELVGEINSDPNREAIISDDDVNAAYINAYDALESMVSSQDRVDEALADLSEALSADEEDTELPIIEVAGIENNAILTSSELDFAVTVTDNVSEAITPQVKLNGTVITGTDGQYTATLIAGNNTIAITAEDEAGNKAEQNFAVTYKQTFDALLEQQIDANLAYIQKTVTNPIFGTGSGDWSVLSLARGQYDVPNGYYDLYYNNVANKVTELMTANSGVLDKTKSTEHSRVILGLTSVGRDITDIAGFDLRSALADFDYVKKQGNNGPIFALIALDSHDYEIPDAPVGKTQTTRENLVQFLLDKEIKKGTDQAGGWALGTSAADVDMTAMALQALVPYYETNTNVKGAADRAIAWLSKAQSADGGYTSWGSSSSESIAQVITALSGFGVDAHTDERFIKNGISALDALLAFAVPEGGFKHVKTGKVDGMATDQGTYALVAYSRYINGLTYLYDMTDVDILTKDTEQPVISVDGLVNDQEVNFEQISFGISVTDNRTSGIVPQVKLNGTEITGINGQYTATLVPGSNTITVTAEDEAGNKAGNTFNIVYKKSIAFILEPQLQANLDYIHRKVTNPVFGTGSGDWSVLTLARGEYDVSNGYYDIYYNNVSNKVTELMAANAGVLDKTKGTEHSRVILGLTAIGKDITNVGGFNLLSALADLDYVTKQGNNGPIFALLAFDSHDYAIPVATEGKTQTTRESLIQYLLDKEIKKGTEQAGGWALGTSAADPDMTAMALQALAPYYETNNDVKGAADRAVSWLSKAQSADGGYTSWGSSSSESIAQVITALSALGIDAHTDARFVKNGISALEALLAFAVPEGGFKHLKTGQVDGMATDQGTYALVAYDRLLQGTNSLYDMTDVELQLPELPQENGELPLPEGDKPEVIVPQDNKEYSIPITASDSGKEVTITIPEGKSSKVSVDLSGAVNLPEIKAVKGGAAVFIPTGTQVVSGDASAIELLTSKSVTDLALIAQISDSLPDNRSLDALVQAFSMGGSERVEFSDYVTLTFAGKSGKDAAYIEGGIAYPIGKFANDAAGKASGKNEYAYDSGSDLIVKTNHFTDYVAYSSSEVEAPGGGTEPQPKTYATLSVDKMTISKGYVLRPTKVELQSGDTVWTVLKRVLDSKNIDMRYSWNEEYNSVYVESIAGDGEFDHGQYSGWMYNVNGIYPNYGASLYELEDGDVVQWRYTKNLGEDLGAPIPELPTEDLSAELAINPNESNPVVQVPNDAQKNYFIKLSKEHNNTDNITVQIPTTNLKLQLQLADVADGIPHVTAVKGNITAAIAKGTKLLSGPQTIELLSAPSITISELENLIKSALAGSAASLKNVNYAFVLGNDKEPVKFDTPVTISLKDAAGQVPGYYEKNTFTEIKVYDTEEQGALETKDNEKKIYAFVNGNDLVIKSNTGAAFVAYTKQAIDIAKLYSDSSSISAWAYQAITDATGKGFVQGSNGKFNPKSTITRAEFTKLLVSVLGLKTDIDNAIAFTDVAKDDWFYPYVNAAYKAGFVSGYDNKFDPSKSITREQMAATIVRALGLQAATPVTPIKDLSSVSNWANKDVQTIVALELMLGYGNQFQPKADVTREMAAVVAMRAYALTGKQAEQPEAGQDQAVKQVINEAASYLQKTVTNPIIASIGGEWSVLGLARSGVNVPDGYYAKYFANVEQTLKEKEGKLHHVKYTEYDRVVLALTALGKKVDNVAGYNLLKPLADFNTVIKQGINGPIFALIALDSKGYEIPVDAAVMTQTTRELLIDFILGREIAGGGWALGEEAAAADPDLTAMAIQSLTSYYGSNEKVKAAVDRGLVWLSKAQLADGSYASWGSSNAESIAQVIVALSGLGIDADIDPRFVKNGHSALDALLGFAVKGGGFYHVKPGGIDNGGAKPGEVDLMATDQSFYALVAYDRFIKGLNRLYEMSDVA
jgi:prenyltransferase beta subunit